MARPKRIFLVAAEPSGDALGAGLIQALRRTGPVDIAGVGGQKMAAEGVESAIDISDLAILGLLDGLKSYGTIRQRVKETAQAIEDFLPDAVVLIDSWGFMIRVAKEVRKLNTPPVLIKYVGPQIWATRPGRAGVLAKAVDHLLTIHAFDAPLFEDAGLPTTFVGNPTLERDVAGDGDAFRSSQAIESEQPVIGVLFGSRPSEFRRLVDPIMGAVAILAEEHPRAIFVSPLAEAIADEVRARAKEDARFKFIRFFEGDNKRDALGAMDAALACSGTVTTELAMAGIPTVATYRVGWLTWLILRFLLLKTEFVSLVNIAAGQELILERLQTRAQPVELAKAVNVLMNETKAGKSRREQLVATTSFMRGDGNANGRAAKAVMDIITARAG